MQKILKNTTFVKTEDGNVMSLSYYIVSEQLDVEDQLSEMYGVCVSDGTNTEVIGNITTVPETAQSIIDTFIHHQVTPTSARDVIDDYLTDLSI